MRKYELVVVLDWRTSVDDRNQAINEIEAALGKDAILEKDEIGALTAAYDLSGKTGNNQIYLISYYCELSPEAIEEVKKKVTYVKALMRYFFYSMKANQPFFKYKDLKKKFEKEAEKQAEAEAKEEEKEEAKAE